MKQIYLDNSATTPVDKVVMTSMLPYFDKLYGNPSEYHSLGTFGKRGIEKSRLSISKFLGANPDEIIFTSGASESINLAIKGLIESITQNKNMKPHVITSSIEHKAVLETLNHLEKLKLIKVTYLPVNRYGLIDKKKLINSINNQTMLISIMYVNNEVGTIEPIREIGIILEKINKKRNNHIYFHTDATQALNYLDCKVNYLKVDMLSFSGHKIYAPKGIGVLYKKKDIPLVCQIDGGKQEYSLRSGTENVPYIVGIGKAVSILNNSKGNINKMILLRNFLIKHISQVPNIIFTGHPENRIPNVVSFCVKGVEGESMVLHLSSKNIFASSGSACASSSLNPSHVLSAIGIPPEMSHGSLRFSLGKYTTKQDIEKVVKELPKIINKLRAMSPKLEIN